ncbi:MAG TPA: hypothetical protein PK323_10060 [Bacteroidia bacterium]|nr:hypothetical protein [Bacteroidia bacterium]
METANHYIIYNQNGIQKVDLNAYKNWLKFNWNNYNTGLENVRCMNDKVSTGFISHLSKENEGKPFVVMYYPGGNLKSKHVIKEYYASWEEALKRHIQFVECGYCSLKQNAA